MTLSCKKGKNNMITKKKKCHITRYQGPQQAVQFFYDDFMKLFT